MIETIIIAVFVLGYLLIAMEHTIKIDKLVPALVMMSVIWAIISLFHLEVFDINTISRELDLSHLDEVLLHHLGKTAEILVFLLGAMTIVEIIDYFDGFSVIKKILKTKKKTSILWIISFLAFFLSAIIDNLTATIVLITILQKLIKEKELRLWMAGLIIISANAGGAWSPIGDITTTMLWIGKKVTTVKLIEYLIIPSLVCMLVPVFIASKLKVFKGEIENIGENQNFSKHGQKMLIIGLLSIIFVPIFKTLTHLPPYVGMMLSLGIVASFAEYYSKSIFDISNASSKDSIIANSSPIHHALTKIELPSILFFLGILMAVGGLESLGMVYNLGEYLVELFPNLNYAVVILGFISAAIDNVPLVATSMGMFGQGIDDPLWHGIAYSAGTGGSMIIIGSAAGVVAMGMEKIDFMWYLKKISWLALIGFLSGFAVYYLFEFYL